MMYGIAAYGEIPYSSILQGGASYSLEADAGSYVLTGQSTSLKADRTFVLGAGSYTLTGKNVALIGPDTIIAVLDCYPSIFSLLDGAIGIYPLSDGDTNIYSLVSADPCLQALLDGDIDIQ